MRKTFLLLSLISSLITGCLYVAPIEEEEDVLPSINPNAVTPTPGVVEMDLSEDPSMNISLSLYDDDNEDQELFHRVVMDFRPAGESRVTATEPRVSMPGSRERIMYQFKPCSMLSSYSGVIQDEHSIDMYLLIADRRFMSDTELVISKEGEFQQPFKTNPENHDVRVHWSVVFKGTCPTQDAE